MVAVCGMGLEVSGANQFIFVKFSQLYFISLWKLNRYMKFNTEEHLDENNKKLLSEIRNKMSVTFEIFNKPYFENFSINNSVTVYVNPQIFTNSSVAHELLHAWFRSLGLHGSNMIYLSAREKPKFSVVFDKKLCDHIGNCMDHYKIYPKFLEMGYVPEDFLSSKGMQCDINSIRKLRIQNNGVYSAKHLNSYIGNLISIYADHLPNDYSQHLAQMQSIEPELFDIVTEFWQAWENVDIENPDHITRTDFETINDFIMNIECWIENKSIY